MWTLPDRRACPSDIIALYRELLFTKLSPSLDTTHLMNLPVTQQSAVKPHVFVLLSMAPEIQLECAAICGQRNFQMSVLFNINTYMWEKAIFGQL